MAAQPTQTKAQKFLITVGVSILIVLTINNLITIFQNNDQEIKTLVLGETDTDYQEERSFWQNFLDNNPKYIKGWISLSRIEHQLKNYDLAKIYLEKARQIDPNYPEILNFRFED